MRFWLSLNFEPLEQLLDHARSAEALGFEGVVLPDHVVVKVGDRTPHPLGYPLQPEELFVDPLCAVSAMAAVTTTLRFMTWICVVPLREPCLFSKQLGSVVGLSGGRFVLGAGAGWLREEFEIVGSDFDSRGGRFDEMLEIVRDFLDDGYAEYHGRYYDIPRSGMFPVPQQSLPIWMGGHSAAAARRAARHEGYMPMNGLDDQARRDFELIDAIRSDQGIQGPFERLILAPEATDPAGVRRLEDEGITSILVTPWEPSNYSLSFAEKYGQAERFASEVIAKDSRQRS